MQPTCLVMVPNLRHCDGLQAALHASHQAKVSLESELQKSRATASNHSAATTQAAVAFKAELETAKQQLCDSQQRAEALQVREEEARTQAKQLATALTAAQVDYQVLWQAAPRSVSNVW